MRDLTRLPNSLIWPLRWTHAGLWAERVTRAFWPLWSWVLAVLAIWGTGMVPVLSPGVAGLGALVGGGALIAALWHLRRFVRPTRAEALARLDATLPGRPIQALRDTQSIGGTDLASQAVWAAHLARMEARLAQARAIRPDLRVSGADPYALRYGALLGLALTVLFGGVWRGSDLATGLGSGAAQAVQTGPDWEIWLEPPRYTGKPTLYLADVPFGPVEVPQGTQVIARLYGQVGALSLSEGISGRLEADLTAPAQSFEITRSGPLGITGAPSEPLWSVVMLQDMAPSISAAGPPRHDPPSGMRLGFEASDDYGITAAQVRFQIDLGAVDRRHGLALPPEPRDPLVLDLPLPISGDRADFAEILMEDLSKHPFANLPVSIVLEATDAANQTGAAAPFTAELPGRSFFNPVANALIEQRRDLLWSRENAPRVAQILRTIVYLPDAKFDAASWPHFATRLLINDLERPAPFDARRRDLSAELLWEIALRIEESSLDGALERLRQARERLSEAIRQGASPEEIERLMEEMRQAMDDYMRQRAEQQAQDPDAETQQQGERQEVTQDQLDQLLDRIQELMEQGRTAEAQQLLQELQDLMENLEMQQGQGGQGSGQPSPGEQAMEDLRDTLREQQELSDEAFRELQEQFGAQSEPGAQAESLAERQGELRDQLNQLQRNVPGQGTPEGDAAREALREAERAMDEAERGLAQDRLADAIDDQSRAMDALREGMEQLGRAMTEAQQQGQQEGQGREFGQAQGRDPLGRDRGAEGQFESDGEFAQSDEAGRARELQDEIRRRSAEQDRPEVERDYLNRLLDRF